jgi:hypothetical protein
VKLSATRTQVMEALDAGRSVEEVVARGPRGQPIGHGTTMLNRALRQLPQLDQRLPIVRRVRRLERALSRQLGGRTMLTTAEKLLIAQVAKRIIVADRLGECILSQLEAPKDGHLLAQMLVWDGMGRTVTAMLEKLGLAQRRGPRSAFD